MPLRSGDSLLRRRAAIPRGGLDARATGEIGSACEVRDADTVAAMRFSYAETLCDPTHYLPLARAVEDAGWDTFIVPDSICYPEVSDSKYPYTPDGNREFLEDKPFIEPFSLIPAMGAVTSRLRFTTFVVKLPIRHPVLVAKSAASVAVMTQGPLRLRRRASPWPDDFAVTGTEWETRGKRDGRDDRIVRGLLRGGYFEVPRRRTIDVPSIKICPVPPSRYRPDRRPHRAGAASRSAPGRRVDARGRGPRCLVAVSRGV